MGSIGNRSGGMITVRGLSAEVIKNGSRVTVVRGGRVVKNVTGTLEGQTLAAVGSANSWGYQDVWMHPVALEPRLAEVQGNELVIMKSGNYWLYSRNCTYTGQGDTLGNFSGTAYLEQGDRFSAFLPWKENGNGSEMACLFLAWENLL